MIRDMTEADVAAVVALGVATGIDWTTPHLSALIPAKHGFARVVDCQGEIIAALVAYVWPGEAELLDIATSIRHRRQGHAKALLEALIAACKTMQIDKVFCDVAGDNIPALSLYRNTGFEPIHLRAQYYRGPKGPQDALVMCCVLNE